MKFICLPFPWYKKIIDSASLQGSEAMVYLKIIKNNEKIIIKEIDKKTLYDSISCVVCIR